MADRSFDWLRADGPLVSPSDDLNAEAPLAERGDDQPAARVGGIRLGRLAVEIDIRAAALGVLERAGISSSIAQSVNINIIFIR
jgi:hypothetical protein